MKPVQPDWPSKSPTPETPGENSIDHTTLPDTDKPKRRQKIEKDVGSRWVAPILLGVTVLLSLLLKAVSYFTNQ